MQGVDRAIAELKKPATGLGLALGLVLFVVLTAAVLPRQRLHMADDLTPGGRACRGRCAPYRRAGPQ